MQNRIDHKEMQRTQNKNWLSTVAGVNAGDWRKISPFGRLCENYVHGSTALTTNEMASLESKYLSARPELSRRVPIEFPHSLAIEMTTRIKCFFQFFTLRALRG